MSTSRYTRLPGGAGVVGISNNIIVTPKVSPGQVQAKIEEAFKREAEIDARHISVAVSDHTASLYGHVHSLNEANAARARSGAPRLPVHAAEQLTVVRLA